MNKKILFGLVLLIISAIAVIGATETGYFGNFVQDEWTTGNSIENLTFNGTNNQTLYVSLPKYSNITYTKLNISTNNNLTNLSLIGIKDFWEEASIEDIVLYWSFDPDYINGTKVIDLSGGGNDGTAEGGVGFDSSGMINNSAMFDGSDDYIVSNFVPTSTNFSFGGWVYLDSLNEEFDSMMGCRGNGKGVVVHNSQELDSLYFAVDASGNSGSGWKYESHELQAGEWYFLTVTYNSTHVNLYINNEYINSVADSSIDWDGNNCSLGVWYTGDTERRLDGKIDEFSFWSKSLTEEEITELYNNGSGYKPTPETFSFNGSEIVTSFEDEINSSLSSCTTDSEGYCQVPFIFTADSAGNLTADIGNSINYSLAYNFTYPGTTIEKTLNTYTLKVFTNETVYSDFYLNGTLESSARSPNDYYTDFISQSRGSWVDNSSSVLSEDFQMYWQINLSNNLSNTSTYNQTNYKIYLNSSDSCSANEALNFTIKDEETDGLINGTFDGTFDVWYSSSAYSRSYPFSLSGENNYKICMYPNEFNYTTNAVIDYNSDGYGVRNYYLNSLLINNNTQNVLLYLLNSSSSPDDVTINVQDGGGAPLPDYLVQIERYDPGTDTFSLVNLLETDDSGQVVADLILNDVFYKFSVKNPSGVVVYTSSEKKIYSTELYLFITEGFASINYFEVANINVNLSYVNASNEIRYYFSDSENVVTQGCLEVYKSEPSGETAYCTGDTYCLSLATGTIDCDLPDNATGTYFARSYVEYSGTEYLTATLSQQFGGFYKTTGKSGVVLSIILTGTMAFIGLFNPIVAVVMVIVGLIMSYLLNLVFLSQPLVISLFILGGILLFKLRK